MKRSEDLIVRQAMDAVMFGEVLQGIILQTHEIFIYVRPSCGPNVTALGYVMRTDFPSSMFKHDTLYRADVVFQGTRGSVNIYKPYDETIREISQNEKIYSDG